MEPNKSFPIRPNHPTRISATDYAAVIAALEAVASAPDADPEVAVVFGELADDLRLADDCRHGAVTISVTGLV